MNARDANGHDPSETPVVLVLMPYADVTRPSVALGTLKACLTEAGIGCAVDYANVRFTERVGLGMPEPPYLAKQLGEWTFAAAAFPEQKDVSAEDALRLTGWQFTEMPQQAFADRRFVESLQRVREFAPVFVDEVARSVLARKPRIVGCSSMFEQHCASLALLRRIRELDPSVITMLGGANCEAEMGWATIRCFPWVDVVVSGEADEFFAPLCRMLLDVGRDLPQALLPSGVMTRQHVRNATFGPGRTPVPRAIIKDLGAVPVPDYSDYIAAIAGSPLRECVTTGLPIEFSRGCWWGQKHHCTFCGLNGGSMVYRAKSPERALEELDELFARYGMNGFMVVDNIIDLKYLRTVLPALAERGAPYRLFFETKANLKREQVALLEKSGVVWIQPGIESFHDELLRLMDKGTTGVINLQLLKYCREFGIQATWNILFGFPGEDDAWHAEIAEWLPLCFHLQSPRSVGRVLYDRFSPYQQRPAKYGLKLEPSPSYQAAYSLAPEDLAGLAYFFYDDSPGARAIGPGLARLIAHVVEWSRLFESGSGPVLSMAERGESIDFFDTRPCASARRITISGLDAKVYLASEPAADLREVCRRLGPSANDEAAVQETLERLVGLRLMLNLHGKYLALAVPGDSPTLITDEEFPGGCVNDHARNSRRSEDTFSPAALAEFEKRTRALAGPREVERSGVTT